VRLRFEIRDTGRGIREDEIGKLFERYSQTESGRRSSEGTGLGLPIARSFVQLMGGDITVESRLGEGTAFRFYVLCDELAPARIETIAATASLDEKTAQRISGFTSSLGEVRILIAEDQPTNRLLLRRILGKAGFTLAEAENGREAIEKWREWHPHLILMDEDMPVMKGSEATRESQARRARGRMLGLRREALPFARALRRDLEAPRGRLHLQRRGVTLERVLRKTSHGRRRTDERDRSLDRGRSEQDTPANAESSPVP
jgi:CheY-like chemotaxis protein